MSRALMCVIALSAPMSVLAAEVAGYVLEMQGRWLQKGDAIALTVGAPLPAGALVMAPAPAAGDRITVVAARTGAVLLARRCDDAATCRKPVALPVAPVASTRGFLDRIFAALADRPDRYVTTLNRGATSPADEVLVWDAGRLDLAPMLAGQPEAVYEVTLTPLSCPGAVRCTDAPVEAKLVWSPRAPLATVELARSGLFELSWRRSGQAAALPPERNWILAARSADAAAARERLNAATALADGWGDIVQADVKRTFTRAALSIADR